MSGLAVLAEDYKVKLVIAVNRYNSFLTMLESKGMAGEHRKKLFESRSKNKEFLGEPLAPEQQVLSWLQRGLWWSLEKMWTEAEAVRVVLAAEVMANHKDYEGGTVLVRGVNIKVSDNVVTFSIRGYDSVVREIVKFSERMKGGGSEKEDRKGVVYLQTLQGCG